MSLDRFNQTNGNTAKPESTNAERLTILDVFRGLLEIIKQRLLTSNADP